MVLVGNQIILMKMNKAALLKGRLPGIKVITIHGLFYKAQSRIKQISNAVSMLLCLRKALTNT